MERVGEGKATIPKPCVFGWNKDGKFTQYYTGLQLFETVVPETVYLERKSNYFESDSSALHADGSSALHADGSSALHADGSSALHADGSESKKYMDPAFVNIENGNIHSGIIDKKCLGTSEGGLVHIIFNDLGNNPARKFLNMVQQVSNWWLSAHSFTVGYGDTIADPKTNQKVESILDKVKEEIAEIVRKRNENEIEIQPGRTIGETFEFMVNEKLNKARDDAGKNG